MKVSIGDAILYDSSDGSGAALSGLDGIIRREVQEDALVDAVEPFIKDRGNKTAPVSFTVVRANADVEAALVAMFEDEGDIPIDTPLIIRHGATVITIAGTLESVRVRHTGSRSFHDYTFRGGRPVKSLSAAALLHTDGSPLLNTDDSPLLST